MDATDIFFTQQNNIHQNQEYIKTPNINIKEVPSRDAKEDQQVSKCYQIHQQDEEKAYGHLNTCRGSI